LISFVNNVSLRFFKLERPSFFAATFLITIGTQLNENKGRYYFAVARVKGYAADTYSKAMLPWSTPMVCISSLSRIIAEEVFRGRRDMYYLCPGDAEIIVMHK